METYSITAEKCSNIFYRKAGKGPVVVLLHGFPEDGSLWDKIVPALAASFTLIIPDIPGSGKSNGIGEDITIEDLSEAVYSILQQEKVSEVLLAGHSMGGYIALAFAEKYPSILKGLSLIHSTAMADTEEKKETRKKSIALIRKGGKETFIKQMIPNLFSKEHQEQKELMQVHIEHGMKLSDESIVAFYTAMIKRPDRTPILKQAKFPVQWIAGKEDAIIPPEIVLKQSAMSEINFVSLYANCGHMSMIEQPEKLTDDLMVFATYCYNR